MATIENHQLQELSNALETRGVEYLYIGKSAAIIHGFADTTQDADIYVNPSEGNKEKVVQVLKDIGFELTTEQEEDIRRGRDFVQLSNGPFDLDLIYAPDGIEQFEDAWQRGRTIEGHKVCSIEDVIASKKAAGRPKDRESISRLEAFSRYLTQRPERGERLPPLIRTWRDRIKAEMTAQGAGSATKDQPEMAPGGGPHLPMPRKAPGRVAGSAAKAQRRGKTGPTLAAFGLAAGFLASTLAGPADAQQTTSTWRAPRTAWGDPDLQGTWTNVTATPLERPADLAGRAVLSEEERAERFRQFTLETTTDVVPRAGSTGSHNEYWRERGVLLRRTSLLVDPPDGRLPPLTPEAQQARDRLAARWRTNPADGPESRDLFERCVTRGLPGTMMGNFYNHNYEILQTPDHVAILAEMIHDARIVPLDGRPHVDRRIGQWLGDPRGWWEGDTLVVETTNLRAVEQTTISRGLGVITLGTSAAARIVERFTRRGPEAIDYQVTVDDPAVYTAPWTAAVPMTPRQGPLFEYACHEGNYGMPGILAGHRAEERAAVAANRP